MKPWKPKWMRRDGRSSGTSGRSGFNKARLFSLDETSAHGPFIVQEGSFNKAKLFSLDEMVVGRQDQALVRASTKPGSSAWMRPTGIVLLLRSWDQVLSVSFLRLGMGWQLRLPGQRSLRGRRLPPHDGVRSAGVGMSTTRFLRS
jgi:hypothetical protein